MVVIVVVKDGGDGDGNGTAIMAVMEMSILETMTATTCLKNGGEIVVEIS